jgi:hypothetical protein
MGNQVQKNTSSSNMDPAWSIQTLSIWRPAEGTEY